MSGISLKSNKNFIESMKMFETDRKIDTGFVLDTLKEAIVKTYQKHIEAPAANVRVDFDGKEMHIFHILEVVDDDSDTFDETLDILYSEAVKENPNIKVGDSIEHEVDFKEISRTSINVAKQMLKQKIKEYEKQKVYDEYKDKESELISGIIKTVEEKFVLVDIKNTIGILLKSEQIPGEVYREGNTIKAIIKEVSKNSKGSQVVLSRASAMFVKRLFEKEVPEIQQGIVEIKAIAREAGERTKMAVYSRNEDVDAIGACIGLKGNRVQGVISEVKGEKIDVFDWNDDIGELVKNALAPAEVKACFYSNALINPELTDEKIEKEEKHNNRPLVVVVEDDKLSIAIGKKGKNAKLAVKLTGRKIDIKTESEIAALNIDVEKEVEFFKEDQIRIKKEREAREFLELQKEAAKRKAEFDEEIAANDTGLIEEALEEMEEKPEEITYVDENDENVEEEVIEEEAQEEKVEEDKPKANSEIEEIKITKKPLVPRTDYVSKFEEIAGSTKKNEEKAAPKKRKRKDDEDRRLRAENLEKKEYDEDVKPIYSDEELEEIRLQEEELEEDSWINDDDIDFDEYDEYYDEEN